MFKFSKSKNIDFSELFHHHDNLYDHLPVVRKKRARRRRLRRLRAAAYAVFIAGLLVFIMAVPYLISGRLIYREVIQGKAELEQAAGLAQLRQFDSAASLASAAQTHFELGYYELEGLENHILSRIPPVNAQLNDVSSLIASAGLISQGVEQASLFAKSLSGLFENTPNLTFDNFSRVEKAGILKRIYESGPDLESLGNTLNQAYARLADIRRYSIVRPFLPDIASLRDRLNETAAAVSEAAPLAKVLPALFGYPDQAVYLVLLENSDELRPTGGFIGTFGNLEVDYGDITEFATHDIYHLDMPVKDLVTAEPPAPLAQYLGVDRWYLRDANWSPDWSVSAEQIERMYLDEIAKLRTVRSASAEADEVLASAPKGDIDGVIALTPKFFTDLLKITGPITVAGVEYNDNNFTDLLEYKVEQDYIELGTPSWQRKEVIGALARELKIRLFNLPVTRWNDIITTIVNGAREKDILVYFKDPAIEAIIAQAGYSGNLSDTDGDYLGVFDANLAALKTDAVMSRSLDYAVEQGPNGLFADLELNYAHQGNFDWKTTRYRSYTRVYAPLGSELISATGFSEAGAETSVDRGKTVFSGFLSVEPGQIGNLALKYKLPERLNRTALTDGYSLDLQKQPGSAVDKIVVDVHLLGEIGDYGNSGFNTERVSPSEIMWTDTFRTDKMFKVEISR